MPPELRTLRHNKIQEVRTSASLLKPIQKMPSFDDITTKINSPHFVPNTLVWWHAVKDRLKFRL